MKGTYKGAAVAVSLLTLFGVAACGNDKKDNTSSSSTTAAGSSTTAASGEVAAGTLTSDMAAMKLLKPLVAQGKGKVAVLLPDTASSARYVSFDAPLLEQAFKTAGYASGDYIIDNAQGSATTMQQQAEAAITAGASVILIDQLDSGSAASIEKDAAAKGVKVVDYDRLTKGGVDGRYYVSFDNVKVGGLIGAGLVQCVSDWKVSKPQVLFMNGDPTDNNATLFAQGYHAVIDPKITSGAYTKVAEPGGTWNNQQALTIFEQQYAANPNINTVVTANDGLGQSVISALKTKSIRPSTIPTTGQDATTQGLQNVLANYQCGTVYKPISVEAQAAVAIATYLRAGKQPPASLVNGTTKDTTASTNVPSVLLTPVWVTAKNMNDTVIKDNFVKPSDLCTPELQAACQAAGIPTS
ncbi:MAG TPA: substrate-binding domain-containing protein [Acidimicrobiales bacterium]|nr:substrate-binding domain-containing protein [Acidimicrobiales bacterium]